MLLGGTVVGSWSSPKEWEALLARSRFRAITAPFNCRMSAGEIEAYRDICARHGARDSLPWRMNWALPAA